jgi:hypothetical protein
MCVGIMVVVREIIKVAVAEAVVVDAVVSRDVELHLWNRCPQKEMYRRNRMRKQAINVVVLLELDSVFVSMVMGAADSLPRYYCGWYRELSYLCFISCVISFGRRQIQPEPASCVLLHQFVSQR